MTVVAVSLDVAPLVFVLPADPLCLGAGRVQVEAGAPLSARHIKLLPEFVKMHQILALVAVPVTADLKATTPPVSSVLTLVLGLRLSRS